jgi:hypothetical protein
MGPRSSHCPFDPYLGDTPFSPLRSDVVRIPAPFFDHLLTTGEETVATHAPVSRHFVLSGHRPRPQAP